MLKQWDFVFASPGVFVRLVIRGVPLCREPRPRSCYILPSSWVAVGGPEVIYTNSIFLIKKKRPLGPLLWKVIRLGSDFSVYRFGRHCGLGGLDHDLALLGDFAFLGQLVGDCKASIT